MIRAFINHKHIKFCCVNAEYMEPGPEHRHYEWLLLWMGSKSERCPYTLSSSARTALSLLCTLASAHHTSTHTTIHFEDQSTVSPIGYLNSPFLFSHYHRYLSWIQTCECCLNYVVTFLVTNDMRTIMKARNILVYFNLLFF